MRKKNYKGRCEKRVISKCTDTFRSYDAIQSAYADVIQDDDSIISMSCNVPLDGDDVGEYTTDFVCQRNDGSVMIRECVQRKHLLKPMTVKLLDMSKAYWEKRGVTDWGLVIDAEK